VHARIRLPPYASCRLLSARSGRSDLHASKLVKRSIKNKFQSKHRIPKGYRAFKFIYSRLGPHL
jgi:hypothetical protein